MRKSKELTKLTADCDQAYFIGAGKSERPQPEHLSEAEAEIISKLYGVGEQPAPALAQLFKQRKSNQARREKS